MLELLELAAAGRGDRLLERLGQRARRRARRVVAAAALAGRRSSAGPLPPSVPVGAVARPRGAVALRVVVAVARAVAVGRADDRAVLARGAVERVVVAVGDPDQPREQRVERAAGRRAPSTVCQIGSSPASAGRVGGAVVGAGAQVDGGASGELAA